MLYSINGMDPGEAWQPPASGQVIDLSLEMLIGPIVELGLSGYCSIWNMFLPYIQLGVSQW
jgi:hypothetical protein